MNYVQKITKIRQRGQMTVPAEIREVLRWPDKEVIVKVETLTDGFKVERLPLSHPQHSRKKLTKEQWDRIFANMKRISKMGRRGVNLTEFLRRDRDTHM